MPRRPVAPYLDVTPHLQTGDLIFARGLMTSSRIIELATGGMWSHVAMVVDGADVGAGDGLCLWESTSIPGQDVDQTVPRDKTGPMLVPLNDRVKDYLSSDNYRLLSARRLYVDRTDQMKQNIAAFINTPAVRLAAYPKERNILCDFLRRRVFGTQEQGTFFCSELIAATWQQAGLLAPQPHSQSYAPRDFSETGFVALLPRAELGQEVYLRL